MPSFFRRDEIEDGLERTFALNHTSYFVMTQILQERLLATPGARIVNTASHAHRGAKIDFSNLQMTSGHGPFKGYCRSKLCNVLFTRELARRLKGHDITANSLHPGFVATCLGDEGATMTSAGFRLFKKLALSPEKGAETMIDLASSRDVEGMSGEYFHRCAPSTPTREARDDVAAERLWQESEDIFAELDT